MSNIFIGSAAPTSDRSSSVIAVFCGLGLVVWFYLIGYGINLGTGWF